MARIDARDVTWAVGLVLCLCATSDAQQSRYAQTHSRSQYVHWIELYDANMRKIDPTDPNPPPYSPMATCGKCHDYEAIAHGYHFNAMDEMVDAGRRGEPWIWTDRRSGTQIPLSFRAWPETYHPGQLGIAPRQFLLKFGRQLPGGGPGEPAPLADDQPSSKPSSEESEPSAPKAGAEDVLRWRQSGLLAIDCMFCHTNGASYNAEVWALQIDNENFAWASTAALGLAQIEGAVKSLPEDYDPGQPADDPNAPPRLPRTTYHPTKFNADKQVFFDIIRKPANNACYYCHTVRPVGEDAPAQWTHDEDVHIKAGMLCADCHRHGIQHHTVRGFEQEQHPTGLSIATLSCRGCHMDEHEGSEKHHGGRMGAPKPLHRGLPPLHLEKMSCTSCHSGPAPKERVGHVQTAMAHGLGLPSHLYQPTDPPGIVSPVLLRDGGTLYPYHMMWPAFWGKIKDGNVTPLNPDEAYSQVRRILRVRRDFAEELSTVRLKTADKVEVLGEDRAKTPESELTDQEKANLSQLERTKALEAFQDKLTRALAALSKSIEEEGAKPIYISGGRAFRLADDGSAQEFSHEATKPLAWKLAHDVRPARWSTGASGCYECHSDGAPLFEGLVTAVGPAPDANPITEPLYQMQGLDKTKIDAWNQSFRGRSAFKWVGFGAMGFVAFILLLYLLLGLNGLVRIVWRGSAS